MSPIRLPQLFAAALLAVGSTGVFAQARVQIVHAAPFADTIDGTSVTVSVNGDAVLNDFLFKDFTPYLELPAGTYDLAVTPTGASEPAITAEATLEDGVDYTVIAIGDGVNQDLTLWPLVDTTFPPEAGFRNLRVVHAAPFAAESADTEVAIRTASGDVVAGLAQVPYFAESGFFPVPAAEYDLKVTTVDGQTNLIDPLPVDLTEAQFGLNVTLIAIGDGVNQPLGILALPIGEAPTRPPVDASANGWWGTVNSENEGLILQPIPAQNRMVGTIYTYNEDGTTRWFTLDGSFDGRFATQATVFRAEGGSFGGQTPALISEAGSIDLVVFDCDTAQATLDLDTGESITWDLERLVQAVPCTLD